MHAQTAWQHGKEKREEKKHMVSPVLYVMTPGFIVVPRPRFLNLGLAYERDCSHPNYCVPRHARVVDGRIARWRFWLVERTICEIYWILSRHTYISR